MLRNYIVWMWSSTSGGYDHQFYNIYRATNKFDAEELAKADKKYGDVYVTRVEPYNPGGR